MFVQAGQTSLHLAAFNGHMECLTELLDRGVAVDHASKVKGVGGGWVFLMIDLPASHLCIPNAFQTDGDASW